MMMMNHQVEMFCSIGCCCRSQSSILYNLMLLAVHEKMIKKIFEFNGGENEEKADGIELKFS